MFSKFLLFLKNNKIKTIVAIIILAGAVFSGFKYFNKTETETRYILAAATKGTINTTISGTGQIAALKEINIKSETSGDLLYLNLQKGQNVKTGTLLAQINSRDAQKQVELAKIDLSKAQISLQDYETDAKDDLDDAIDSGLNSLSNTLKEISAITPDLEPMFITSSYNGSDNDNDIDYYLRLARIYNNSVDLSYWTSTAEEKYNSIQKDLDFIKNEIWNINKNSGTDKIQNAISESYKISKNLLSLVRQSFNVVQQYQQAIIENNLIPPITVETTDEQATTLFNYISSLTEIVSQLSTAKKDISDKEKSLETAKLESQSQNLDINTYKYSLADAQKELAKHFIYATVDGIISDANTDIKVGDEISSASSLGTLSTEQKIANITLSEEDILNVKIGDKAIITFDAIDSLQVSGKIVEVDSTGTTNSGVVSYGVKIAIDSDDDLIKSGMSVSAVIITNSKEDALIVPTSAVKSANNETHYVQVLNENYDLSDRSSSIKGVVSSTAPSIKTVTIGLTDDSNTEITSGLSEGDQIVVRTSGNITSSSTSSSQSRSIINNSGMMGGAGRPPGM
jgi:RND family efflux transporter MFP subunit